MNFRQYKAKLRRRANNQCPNCGLPVQEWQMDCPNCGADVLGQSWPMVDHPHEPPMETPKAPDTIPADLERPSLYGPMPSLPSNPDDSSSGLTVPEHFQHGDMVSPQDFEQFMHGYFESALWTSSIEEEFAERHNEKTGEDWAPDQSLLDFGFTVDDIDESSKFEATQECRNFVNDNAADLNQFVNDYDWGQAGHDFWLTRNGHGAGFWDRGGSANLQWEEIVKRLSEAAKIYGESYAYIGSGDKVYIQ